MADVQEAGAAAAEGQKKRKLSQLRPKTRKKLKQQQQAELHLAPEEKHRRQEQKRQRDLALKLRAEGRSYDPKVFKHKKQQKDGAKHPKAKVKIKSSQRNKAPYQVIILPIAWHQRKEESARILVASEKAQQLLQAGGLTCRIDDGDKFSPGQKMKYWELRGVRVRLEIGPKESLAGTAVLAVAAAAPGQVANKSSVKVAEPQLSQRVKQALHQLGQLPGAVEEAAGEAAGTGQTQLLEPGQAGSTAAARTGPAEPAGQHPVAAEEQAGSKKRRKDKYKTAAEAKGGDNTKKQTTKEQLKAQLAALGGEQQVVSSVLDKVIVAAAGSEQRRQQQQHTPAAVPPSNELVSGDAIDDDFHWTAKDDHDEQRKGTRSKQNKHVNAEKRRCLAAGDGVQPARAVKAKVVKF